MRAWRCMSVFVPAPFSHSFVYFSAYYGTSDRQHETYRYRDAARRGSYQLCEHRRRQSMCLVAAELATSSSSIDEDNPSDADDAMAASTWHVYPRCLFRLELFRSFRALILMIVLLILLPLLVLMALANSRSGFHLSWSVDGDQRSLDTPLEPLVLCQGVRLMLLIPSAPYENVRRDVIRETWGNGLRGSSIRLIFVVGRAAEPFDGANLHREWERHKDILYRPSLHDSYDRLTQKSLFALGWASNACPHVPFLAKVDSDVFLRTDNLVRLIHHLPSATTSNFILGQVNVRARPKRDPTSKWFAPRHVYSSGSYPNYVFGAFYLMPSVTARRLIDNLQTGELQFAEKLKLEDVFITGILAKRLGINRRHHRAFRQRLPSPGDLCTYPQLISVHHVNPSNMRLMWKLSNEC